LAEAGSIDLDASALLFNAGGQVVDTVWFRQLVSKDGALRHSGDNLTGDGDGDDEAIAVDLRKLAANVETIVLTVNSFRGQTFDKVENAFGQVVDNASGRELARFDISDSGPHTGIILASLKRENGEWTFKALALVLPGRRCRIWCALLPHSSDRKGGSSCTALAIFARTEFPCNCKRAKNALLPISASARVVPSRSISVLMRSTLPHSGSMPRARSAMIAM
jgi:stress response protein SCP2